ncbi:MAG: hypothetical protein AB8A39_02095, partial [Prochlorococcus sp.]
RLQREHQRVSDVLRGIGVSDTSTRTSAKKEELFCHGCATIVLTALITCPECGMRGALSGIDDEARRRAGRSGGGEVLPTAGLPRCLGPDDVEMDRPLSKRSTADLILTQLMTERDDLVLNERIAGAPTSSTSSMAVMAVFAVTEQALDLDSQQV